MISEVACESGESFGEDPKTRRFYGEENELGRDGDQSFASLKGEEWMEWRILRSSTA